VNTLIDSHDARVLVGSHIVGGAVKRVGELDTAFPHRNAELTLVVASMWEEAALDEERIAAARAVYSALEPFMGGYYSNIDFDHSKTAGNYGPAYPRLAKVKRQFDPDNFFRLNSNIKPA
jgi:FAD/FMN-containing dehydrogenase